MRRFKFPAIGNARAIAIPYTRTSSTHGPSPSHLCQKKTRPGATASALPYLQIGKATGGILAHVVRGNIMCALLSSETQPMTVQPDSIAVPCRITLHFEAVNNAFYAWLNGQLLGYSQDSCLPAEFDVTDIVSTGENVLAVQVRLHPSQVLSASCHCSFRPAFLSLQQCGPAGHALQ